MSNQTNCPGVETLDDLLANRLPTAVADAIRAHIETCGICQRRLGQEAVPTRVLTFLSPPEAQGELGRLGPYHIRGVLGEGGMAIVFDAEDPLLGRSVALKVLKPEQSDSSTRDRFLREARILASVHEEHVVALHQIGEENGVAWMAMERLRGETLDDRLKRDRTLAVAEALSLTRQAAEGLKAVHAHGIVHRNIKPSNLWLEVTADGRYKRVKLIDFGIARPTEETSRLTQTNAVVGTPAYLSPEQAASRPIDARSDLYSLGCVLYRMLTGRTPFGETGEDTIAVLRATIMGDITPATSIAPRLPRAVAELLDQMLAIDPDNRPASAAVLIAQLRRLEQQDPGGGSFSPAGASPVGPRRRPSIVGIYLGAITIVAALVVGALAAYYKLVPNAESGPSDSGAEISAQTIRVRHPPLDDGHRLGPRTADRPGDPTCHRGDQRQRRSVRSADRVHPRRWRLQRRHLRGQGKTTHRGERRGGIVRLLDVFKPQARGRSMWPARSAVVLPLRMRRTGGVAQRGLPGRHAQPDDYSTGEVGIRSTRQAEILSGGFRIRLFLRCQRHPRTRTQGSGRGHRGQVATLCWAKPTSLGS